MTKQSNPKPSNTPDAKKKLQPKFDPPPKAKPARKRFYL